jgi:hypothetical protein
VSREIKLLSCCFVKLFVELPALSIKFMWKISCCIKVQNSAEVLNEKLCRFFLVVLLERFNSFTPLRFLAFNCRLFSNKVDARVKLHFFLNM